MTIVMCLTWLVLFYFTVVALLRGKIFTASPEETLRDTRLKRPDLEMALFTSTQVGVGIVSAVKAEEEAKAQASVSVPPVESPEEPLKE